MLRWRIAVMLALWALSSCALDPVYLCLKKLPDIDEELK